MFTLNSYDNRIKVVQGDTGILDLTLDNYKLKDGDTVYFTVKKNYTDVESLIVKEITSFTQGQAKIVLTSEDTNLEIGTYLYDVQCNLADGRIDTIITTSKFQVLGGITGVNTF